MKYVISRGEGPKYDGSSHGILEPGKKYEVVATHIPNGWPIVSTEYNPKETSFYIDIKIEGSRHKVQTVWNDYFLSNEEIRNSKLDELGI